MCPVSSRFEWPGREQGTLLLPLPFLFHALSSCRPLSSRLAHHPPPDHHYGFQLPPRIRAGAQRRTAAQWRSSSAKMLFREAAALAALATRARQRQRLEGLPHGRSSELLQVRTDRRVDAHACVRASEISSWHAMAWRCLGPGRRGMCVGWSSCAVSVERMAV
ncbi:uncharacterized protein J3D65DRAFT_623809 [Phyllosticta citribraziliensis]|uniref:Uncharacterized protein n=1 Tax=Phyllosticta citribraziliensis TaxID=989973 RepID=A0ABR1LP19_9PEZI